MTDPEKLPNETPILDAFNQSLIDKPGDTVAAWIAAEEAHAAALEAYKRKLGAEFNRLRALLKEARDDIEDWGAYADAYFQEKWDLKGTIAKYDSVLNEDTLSPAPSTAPDRGA
jgi:hypothetical protein